MRWFFDTEFYEDGRTIELISLGIVGYERDIRRYYEVPDAQEIASATPWLRENVLPKLIGVGGVSCVLPRQDIAAELEKMLLEWGDPELWAYFADYDWVAFCQLYGRMIDLPKGFPMYCRDLKQLMSSHGIQREDIPVPKNEEHYALHDAIWAREAYRWVKDEIERRLGIEIQAVMQRNLRLTADGSAFVFMYGDTLYPILKAEDILARRGPVPV